MKRVEELKLARLRKAKEAKARAKAAETARYDDIETTQKQIAAQLEALAAIKQDAPVDPTEKLDELNQSILSLAEKLLEGITVKNIGEAKSDITIPTMPNLTLPKWLQEAPDNKDITKAIEQNTLVLKALEKAQKGQTPADFIPVRRVYMQGNRLVFDDSSTGSYSGGGGAVSNGGSSTLTETNYAVRYEKVDANLAYLGEAAIGSATSSPVWRLSKVATVGGAVITWADGDDNFDNVWDDRATASYS